jgi:hypothetical protein
VECTTVALALSQWTQGDTEESTPMFLSSYHLLILVYMCSHATMSVYQARCTPGIFLKEENVLRYVVPDSSLDVVVREGIHICITAHTTHIQWQADSVKCASKLCIQF